MNLWKKFDRFPPVLVRLLARWPDGQMLTDQVIAGAAGMDDAEVHWLGCQPDWREIPVDEARRFLQACNCDLADPVVYKNLTRYLRRYGKFDHLRRDDEWPRWQRLLRVYAETLKKQKP